MVVTHQHDTIGAVAALLMAVAIVVTAGPALSAARADANVALRAEQVFGYGTGFRVIARCASECSEQVGCNLLNCRHLSEC